MSSAARAAAFAGLLAAAGAAPAHAAPPVEDTMAQRVLACTGCHGPQGRAASDGYRPRIAGKPAGYLHQQLLGFRDGRRRHALMAGLLAPLSDAYLREIAEHFAGLDLPYPPPQPPTATPEVLARGEALVRRGDAALQIPPCVACHGVALMGVAPVTADGTTAALSATTAAPVGATAALGAAPASASASASASAGGTTAARGGTTAAPGGTTAVSGEARALPALLGMPRDYLNAQLGAWRNGTRHAPAPDCMAQVARRLAPADITALTQWLAAQPVPTNPTPAVALPAPLPLPCGGVPGPATGRTP